eukprot:2422847-Rhodomonas_salina.1
MALRVVQTFEPGFVLRTHSTNWYAPSYPTEICTRFKRLRNAQLRARDMSNEIRNTVYLALGRDPGTRVHVYP